MSDSHTPHKLDVARRFSGFPFFVNSELREKPGPTSLPHLTSRTMEEVFSDALGLFGAEIEEDDGFVYYGGLKLGVVPKV